jgi:hypothetical protein
MKIMKHEIVVLLAVMTIAMGHAKADMDPIPRLLDDDLLADDLLVALDSDEKKTKKAATAVTKAATAVANVQSSSKLLVTSRATQKDINDCHYPTSTNEFGGSFSLGNDFFGMHLSAGQGFAQCAKGSVVQLKSDACGQMPLAPDTYYNAFGISLPTFVLTMFGFEFDVADQFSSGVGDSAKRTASSQAKRKKALEAAGSAGSTATGDGFCFSYPAEQPWEGDFAFSATGLLVAECCLSATVLQCPCVTEGGPEITLEYLAAGFSSGRDLYFTTTAGLWNGQNDFQAALSSPFVSTGVLYQSAAIGFNAMEFSLGGHDVAISLEFTGKMMIDVKTPTGAAVKQAFTALANPSTFKNLESSSLPGFQMTVDGALGMEVELGPGFAFSADLGGATMTFGMNMQDSAQYKGFTNGVYATAISENCLKDVFPPVNMLSQLKCNGKSIFADLCYTAQIGLYLNRYGMGYQSAFGMKFGGINVDWGLRFTVDSKAAVKLSITGGVTASVGDFLFAANTEMGFTSTIGKSLTPIFKGSLSCNGGCGKIIDPIKDFARDKIWKKISDLFRGEEEENLEDSMQASLDDSVQKRRRRRRRRRRSWNIKHRHHFHTNFKKVGTQITKAVNHVGNSIRNAASDFADLASSFADIKPILKFSTPEVEGDVCGWSLRIKLTVGVKNSVGDVTKSLSLKVGFSTSDMGDALVDGIMTAFDAVKDAFKGLHTAVTSSSKRRRRRRRRRRL